MNDGGATASALGSALADLANNLSPKTQAEAQLLREQTEAADRNNWLLSTRQRGVLDIPGALATMSADPTAAGATGGTVAPVAPSVNGVGAGTVAGTAAGLAQPPAAPSTGFGARDQTAGFSPYAGVVAGSYAADPSMSNFQTGVNVGRTAKLGPGQDYGTQGDIYKAQHVPLSGSAGTQTYIDPAKGNVPGNVLTFGDPAAQAAEGQQRSADTTDANKRADLAENAGQSVQEATRLRDMYNTLVAAPDGNDTLANVSDEFLKTLSASSHYNFTRLSPRIDAINAIQQRMAGLAGNALTQVSVGAPARGILENANKTLADPNSGKELFNSAVDQMIRGYNTQLELAGPGKKFMRSGKLKEDADTYRSEVQAILDKQLNDFKAEQQNKQPVATPPVVRAPAAGVVHPATSDELKDATATVQKVPPGFTPPQWRQRVIDHFKQQGADLTAGGF